VKLLVIGDYISDSYTFGTATRLCPEAPVPVIVPEKMYDSDGGAGLVTAQLAELGADVQARYLSYSQKQRIFAGNHLVCRVDNDSIESPQDHLLIPVEHEDLNYFDAFVISDYGKGGMSQELARQIVDTRKPCFVDAKQHWSWYAKNNVTMFPNEHENCSSNYDSGCIWCPQIVRKLGAKGAIMTVSDSVPFAVDATVSEVVDSTGAGDIFMAAFVYAWSIKLRPEDCLRFANALAGESCRHRGTFVVPRAFAQSVLDRLLASKESQPQAHDLDYGSNLTERQLKQQRDQSALSRTLSEASTGSLRGYYGQAGAKELGIERNVRFERIPPESPLTPTGSTDAQPPLAQAVSDHETTSQTEQQTPSPSALWNQYEHTRGRDQVWHPKKA
jgi:D-glycero-beta-D-manno-heptose-7-phosphate kinase